MSGGPAIGFVWRSGDEVIFRAMLPKKVYSSSAITRLSQFDLRAALEEWSVKAPSGSLDLELRAMLARAIHGGPAAA